MGKKKQGGHDANAVKVNQWWCYYCDTRHEDEFKLIQHQRSKHFLCRLCDPKAYGRNCLSLSGLVSHVRRSHRQELKEVPGAIEGRTSLSVEVSAMQGIPQEALDEFNETLAEEMMAAGQETEHGNAEARAPPPRRSTHDDDEDNAPMPPLPRDDREDSSLGKLNLRQGIKPNLLTGTPLNPGVVAGLLKLHASGKSLAEQAKAKQQEQQPPPEPQPEEVQRKEEVLAFDPSLLAERLAGVNVPPPEAAESEDTKAAIKAREREEREKEKEDEERARRDEEDRRKKEVFLGSIAKDDKHEEVVKVDKNVVQAMGSAFAARAAAAAAAEAKNRASMPKPYKGEPIDTAALRTKLSLMEKNNLFRHAVGVGVNVEDIRSACAGKADQFVKEAIIQLVLKLEAEENWVVCTFKPGKLGITADWISATVKQITEGGQASSNGTKVGMVFKTIDGKKYVKSLLLDKIGGRQNYDVVFALNAKPMPPVYEEEEDYSEEEEDDAGQTAKPEPVKQTREAPPQRDDRRSPEPPPRRNDRREASRSRGREIPPPDNRRGSYDDRDQKQPTQEYDSWTAGSSKKRKGASDDYREDDYDRRERDNHRNDRAERDDYRNDRYDRAERDDYRNGGGDDRRYTESRRDARETDRRNDSRPRGRDPSPEYAPERRRRTRRSEPYPEEPRKDDYYEDDRGRRDSQRDRRGGY